MAWIFVTEDSKMKEVEGVDPIEELKKEDPRTNGGTAIVFKCPDDDGAIVPAIAWVDREALLNNRHYNRLASTLCRMAVYGPVVFTGDNDGAGGLREIPESLCEVFEEKCEPLMDDSEEDSQ
jgi:hypothetical protein